MNPVGGWQRLSIQTAIYYNQSPVGVVISPCCHFEWKIDNGYSSTYNSIFSEYFQFYNVYWRMQMSWCENSNEGTKNVLISLQKKPSAVCPNVDATIGFKRSDGSIFDAIRKVLGHDPLPGLIPNSHVIIHSIPFSVWKDIDVPPADGGLTVVCILKFAETAVSNTTCPQRSDSTLVKNLEDLFQSERDADVIIRVQGKQFKAHRSILVARSMVFATMFQHDMAEREKGEVNIDDCDPDSFQDFLVYLYTGKTDQVTSDNAGGLYITADKYSVEELKENCSKCLSLTLSIDSTCDVLVLATMYNDSNLLKSATDFFVKNAKKIMQGQKWLEFQTKNCTLVHELFLKAADYIKV